METLSAATVSIEQCCGLVADTAARCHPDTYAAWNAALESALEQFVPLSESIEKADAAAPQWFITARENARASEKVRQCELAHDIFGNPFRPVTLDPRWLSSTVLDLARAIYDARAFKLLPILADALMDAGCDSEDILNHCRGPGPHVRGCWVVDLVLAKK